MNILNKLDQGSKLSTVYDVSHFFLKEKIEILTATQLKRTQQYNPAIMVLFLIIFIILYQDYCLFLYLIYINIVLIIKDFMWNQVKPQIIRSNGRQY